VTPSSGRSEALRARATHHTDPVTPAEPSLYPSRDIESGWPAEPGGRHAQHRGQARRADRGACPSPYPHPRDSPREHERVLATHDKMYYHGCMTRTQSEGAGVTVMIKMLHGTFAQCCRVWPVLTGHAVRECGLCGRRPVVLPALGRFSVRG